MTEEHCSNFGICIKLKYREYLWLDKRVYSVSGNLTGKMSLPAHNYDPNYVTDDEISVLFEYMAFGKLSDNNIVQSL
jgi:hypothetical protein